MAEIIILSDTVTNSILGDSRYMGPYVLSTELEKNGFDVVVIDYFTRHPDFFNYLENFIDEKTLLIGISSTFLSRSPDFNRMSNEEYRSILVEALLAKNGNNREEHFGHYNLQGIWFDTGEQLEDWIQKCRLTIKNRGSNAKLVIGGAKTSLLLNQKTLADFDYVAISSADTSIVQLANDLKSKRQPAFSLSNGRRILDNSADLKNKRCPETIYLKKHAIALNESLPIEISRGCIFNCSYCHYDKKESFRKDIKILRDELIRNNENFGTTVYHFCDDCFNDSRKKVIETCEMLSKLPFKIEWISYARLDLAVHHPDTFQAMIESGAKGLFFDIESFNDEAIKRAGKKVPSDKIKEFLINAHSKYNEQCLLEGAFIVGLPGESRESIHRTIQWVTSNKALDFISVARLYLHPYDVKFDQVSIDYSDYSRSPEKNGIEFIKQDGALIEWRHEHMTSQEASQMTIEFLNKWAAQGKNSIFRNIFDYPVLRTLGFSQAEIWKMAKDESVAFSSGLEASKRFNKFLSNYWQLLRENNK